jgi:SAM-dependent methyltransferase
MQNTLSRAELKTLYSNRFLGAADYRVEVWRVLVGFFARWIPPGSTVLDLGAGYCEFINQVSARRKFAMDLNPDTFDRAGLGVTVLPQDCASPWLVPDKFLDVVFTSNFLEHLPDRPALRRTLAEAFRCLKPGGWFLAVGPNIKYVNGAYWDFFDHYLELTEASIAEVMVSEGFRVQHKLARFLPYTMSDGRRYPIWMLKTYLAMPILWRLFGKQFFVIARKPLDCDL